MTDKDRLDDSEMSRRNFMGGTAAAGVAVLTPGYIDVSDVSESGHLDEFTGFLAGVPEDHVRTYGLDSNPGFIAVLDSDDSDAFSKIQDWADDESRELVKEYPDSDRALVAAPLHHIVSDGFAQSSNLLATRDYVESIAVDVEMQIPEEPSPLREDGEVEHPDPFFIDGFGSGDGVAYREDIDGGTLSDAREVIDADQVAEEGSDVTVAVLDDGVDDTVFGDRLVLNENLTDTDTPESDSGHGTWVAEAIAGNPDDEELEGVAPSVDLQNIKVLTEDGGSTADVAEGVRIAAREGVDVINMSLGAPMHSPEVGQAMEEALEEHEVSAIVVAAGNSRQTTRWVNSPASFAHELDGVITVGATTVDGPEEAQSAYFSSVGKHDGYTDFSGGETRGGTVTVGAPGTEIEAPSDTLSGTSMAAPLVSGCLAIGVEVLSPTREEVEDLLEDSSEPAPSCGVTEIGWGLVNVENIVNGIETDEFQDEVRESGAESRDAANNRLSERQERNLSIQFIRHLRLR